MPTASHRVLVALFVLFVPASALAQDDVRAAVMGHEAFMQRCATDYVARTARTPDADPSDDEARQHAELAERLARETCDVMYRGTNVCTEAGAVYAMGLWRPILNAIDEKLADPLTPADDYRSFESLKRQYEAEKAALNDLIAGRSDYCNQTATRTEEDAE